jgi:hypothetical protein
VAAGSSSGKESPNGNPAHEDAVKPTEDKMQPVIPKNGDEETEEIPIAGRTSMTVPKDRNKPKKQEQASDPDEHMDAKTELNSILKRAPSKYSHLFTLGICLSLGY